MTQTVTDSYTLNIQIIQHGIAKILNAEAPSKVESGEPFDISYDCKNNSATNDTLWGHIKDPAGIINGSEWEEAVAAGATVSKTFNHSGIIVPTEFIIEVGHT